MHCETDILLALQADVLVSAKPELLLEHVLSKQSALQQSSGDLHFLLSLFLSLLAG